MTALLIVILVLSPDIAPAAVSPDSGSEYLCFTTDSSNPTIAPENRLFSATLPARPRRTGDRWIAWDKLWHFSASFVSIGAGYHLCANRLNITHRPSVGISIGGTLGLGTGKELLDRYVHKRWFSWKDMAANALGITAGYFVFVHGEGD